jgi:hypothetical protein
MRVTYFFLFVLVHKYKIIWCCFKSATVQKINAPTIFYYVSKGLFFGFRNCYYKD